MAKTKTNPLDTAARATVTEYVRRWGRLGLRATAPALATVPSFDGRVGVVHIDRHGNAISGCEIRMRDIIADFSSDTAARSAIIAITGAALDAGAVAA